MKNVVLICNPYSGKGITNETLTKCEEILKQYKYNPTIIKTEYKGHAIKIVSSLKDSVDLVISLGGDGTFNEIMTGNFTRKTRIPLAHIPVGTTNDVGAMFGYGKDIISNLKLLLDGQIKDIDICKINGRPFTYSASIGKFVKVSYDTPKKLKQKYGYLAYIIGAIKEFKQKTKLYQLKYNINGVKCIGRYSFILVSNANRIAGIDNFYKDIKLNDNTVEVLMCSLSKKSDITKCIPFFRTKDINKVAGFDFYKTNKIEIEFLEDLDISWSLDGEKLETNTKKFIFEIEPNIKIMMPQKNIKKLFIK